MNILNIQALRISSEAGVDLVSRVDLELSAGARLGILGESGSGKSLTALAITRLLPPALYSSGSINLRGTELLNVSEKEMCKIRGSKIAIVFQDPLTSLDPLMKIGKQLSLPLSRYQGVKRSGLRVAVEAALNEVKITDPKRVAHSYPHEISGGERQRVALAMALACQPEILIADEITTSLDVSIAAEVLELLDLLVRTRNMSLIFISHDIATVSQVADDAIVMQAGVIVERGTIAELIRNPQDPYTKKLVRSALNLETVLLNIAQGTPHDFL